MEHTRLKIYTQALEISYSNAMKDLKILRSENAKLKRINDNINKISADKSDIIINLQEENEILKEALKGAIKQWKGVKILEIVRGDKRISLIGEK